MKDFFKPRSTLRSILSEKHIVVCTGAGGVGKTTVTASMAIHAARLGRRVVFVTIDPAHRLADLLDLPAHASDGKILNASEILGPNRSPGGKLLFCMLDPEKTLATLIRARASSPQAAQRIFRNKLYTYLSRSLNGIQEYMVLEQLYKLRNDTDVDLIVLDMPPASNGADFFSAPKRITTALDSKIVGLMRRAAKRKGRPKFLGRMSSSILKVMSRFTGADLMDEIMQFVDALSDLFEGFSKRAKAVEKVLHGDDVSLCLISTPDESTLRETAAFRRHLSKMNLGVDSIVFNRAHWPKADKPPRNLLDRKAVKQAKQLRDIWNASYDLEQALVNQVQKDWAELNSVATIPILPEGVTHIASLDHMAQYF
jgi:anion-transporting  ArsA/GET3 family ATPase